MPADRQTLDIILGTSTYYKLFYAHAKTRLTEENLDFLAAAATYRRDPSKKKAITIIDEFAKLSGTKALNIDGGTKATLVAQGTAYSAARGTAHGMGFFKRHWTAGQRKAAENVFDAAIDEIRQLVISSILPGFLLTGTGQAVEAQIQQNAARAGHTRRALLEMGVG